MVRFAVVFLIGFTLLSTLDAEARAGGGRVRRNRGVNVLNNGAFFNNAQLANFLLGSFAGFGNVGFNNFGNFGFGNNFGNNFASNVFDPNSQLGSFANDPTRLANGFIPINGNNLIGNRVGFGNQLFALDQFGGRNNFVRLGSGLNGSAFALGEVNSAQTQQAVKAFSKGETFNVSAPVSRPIAQ